MPNFGRHDKKESPESIHSYAEILQTLKTDPFARLYQHGGLIFMNRFLQDDFQALAKTRKISNQSSCYSAMESLIKDLEKDRYTAHLYREDDSKPPLHYSLTLMSWLAMNGGLSSSTKNQMHYYPIKSTKKISVINIARPLLINQYIIIQLMIANLMIINQPKEIRELIIQEIAEEIFSYAKLFEKYFPTQTLSVAFWDTLTENIKENILAFDSNSSKQNLQSLIFYLGLLYKKNLTDHYFNEIDAYINYHYQRIKSKIDDRVYLLDEKFYQQAILTTSEVITNAKKSTQTLYLTNTCSRGKGPTLTMLPAATIILALFSYLFNFIFLAIASLLATLIAFINLMNLEIRPTETFNKKLSGLAILALQHISETSIQEISRGKLGIKFAISCLTDFSLTLPPKDSSVAEDSLMNIQNELDDPGLRQPTPTTYFEDVKTSSATLKKRKAPFIQSDSTSSIITAIDSKQSAAPKLEEKPDDDILILTLDNGSKLAVNVSNEILREKMKACGIVRAFGQSGLKILRNGNYHFKDKHSRERIEFERAGNIQVTLNGQSEKMPMLEQGRAYKKR